METKVWIVDRYSAPSSDKKGSRWKVTWYEPKSDGTRKARSRNFAKKPDADAFRTKTEHTLRSGSYRAPENADRTVASVAADFMASRHKPKVSTLTRDERELRTWVFPTFGGRKIGSLTKHEIEVWVSSLLSGTASHEYAGKSATRAPRVCLINVGSRR